MHFLSHLITNSKPSAPPLVETTSLPTENQDSIITATAYPVLSSQENPNHSAMNVIREVTIYPNSDIDTLQKGPEANEAEPIDEKKSYWDLFSETKETLTGKATSLIHSVYDPVKKAQAYWASKEYAIEMIEKNPQNFSSIRPEWQKDPEVVTFALVLDPTIYTKLPLDIQALEEVRNARLLGEEKACVEKTLPFSSLSEATRNNFEMAKIAVEQSAGNLLSLGTALTQDAEKYEELLFIAARNQPLELLEKVKKHKVLTNRNLLLACCIKEPKAIEIIPESFRNDPKFCLEIVENNPLSWTFLPKKFQQETAFAYTAMQNSPTNPFGTTSIFALPENLQKEEEICFYMIQQNQGATFWQDVPLDFALNSEFVQKVEERFPHLTLWDNLLKNQKLYKEAFLKMSFVGIKDVSNNLRYYAQSNHPSCQKHSRVIAFFNTLAKEDASFRESMINKEARNGNDYKKYMVEHFEKLMK